MSSNRIYVGHLSHRTRENDVEDFFSRYGRIREIQLKNGFGFVEFDDARDAEEAVYRANGKEIRGERVVVEMTKRPPRGRGDLYRNSGSRNPTRRSPGRRSPGRNPAIQYSHTKYKLRVKNLSSRLSWQDVKDMFRTVGEVMYADAHREKKNEGVVCFATYSDMKKAQDTLDGKELNGRKIELIEVGSGGRSRSRSRSRSKGRLSSRSKSRSRSRSKSGSRSRSKSNRSKSGSPAPRKSVERNGNARSASRSVSKNKSRSRSKSAVNGCGT